MSDALRTLASISAFFSKTFALWVIAESERETV